MNKQLLKPLALAVGLALAASGCSHKNESSKQSAAPTSSAKATPKPASSTQPAGVKMAAAKNVFDTSELDTKANVCNNLNTFVNAKWVAANPIPRDHTRWGAFEQLADKSLDDQHTIVKKAAADAASAKAGSIEQKIGYLFKSGMDDTAIDKAGYGPIKPELTKVDQIKSHEDLGPYLTQEFADGNGYVFGLGAGADFKNAKKEIAYVDQSGLGLPTPAYYTDKKYASQRKQYLKYITDSFKLVGESDAQARKQANEVMDFETRLAKASLSRIELRKPDNQYHFVTFQQAHKVTPDFDWKAFFKAQNADVEKGFSLSQPKFFAEFQKLLAHAPLSHWKAYLRFHTISSNAPYLSKAFRDNRFDFYGKTLQGQPQQRPRWKQVLSAVNGGMGQALGQLYVAKYFPPEAKARADQLVKNVRQALKQRIEHASWMSEPTRKKALEKWSKFLPKIGYPDTWRSWEGLKIVPDNFYANMQAASKFDHAYEMSKIGKPTDRHRWGMTPQTVNAYYNPTDNTINFPAAILQPPFFYAHGDYAVNYGGIGAVIGHESSHGFDDEGSQFDGNGNHVDWWTKADRTKFDARTQKLVNQFDQYAPIKGKPDLHVKGKLTLGENIADLSGLNTAYIALQNVLKNHPKVANEKINGYTEDQRFFMAWARVWRGETREKAQEVMLNVDPHSPTQFRAIGAPSNMPAFAKAFKCKPGDAMVRPKDKRVQIW